MKRRAFIRLLGGAAAAWPLAARAQQAAVPVVGYLAPGTPEATAYIVTAFRKGLSEGGFVEGRNVAIEYRWAHNNYAQLPELAADLVSRRVAVIATGGGSRAALAAKAATTTIPIVFTTGSDPVQDGLVASLNRPGGNVTGINAMQVEAQEKRVGLLHELLPTTRRLAVLVNPNNQMTDSLVTHTRVAAVSIGRQVEVVAAGRADDIDTAFANLARQQVDGLLVSPDTLFDTRRVQLVMLAVRHALPAIYPFRESVQAGGLMSYGPSFADIARLAGMYTARVLKREKPTDLPVLRATKFEFVVNLQTAKLIGLTVPPMLLARADEVIE
ncbi:MAG TPA: ABC transporter substrate-binding protein [Hyphomicrobiaceae bacterium]|jgi:putative ABC transport system substrate-binding protein|nr:ABC transporter substrate-binding protein [Hyphomicrobiaceae bacterium]